MNSIKRVAPVIIVALVLTLVFGGLVNAPALAQSARQQFGWVFAKRLNVETTSTLTGDVAAGEDLTVASTLTVNGASTLTGNVAASGNVAVTGAATAANMTTTGAINVGTLLRMAPAAAAVLTADATLTPIGSYQPISSTGNIGTANVATSTVSAGTLLYLINVGSATITLTDTGVLKLSGNAVLGGGDTLLLVSDGTNWNQVSKTDN